MITETTSSTVSRLDFMKLVSSPINIASSELEYLIEMPAFSPYEDAHCVDNDDWKELD